MSDDAVISLAQAVGLHVTWEDAAGAPQTVQVDSLRAILSAMDFPSDSPSDIADSRKRVSDIRTCTPGLVVAEAGDRMALPARYNGKKARLRLENGDYIDIDDHGFIAPDAPGYHRLEIGGDTVAVAVAPPKAFTVEEAAPGRDLWGATVQLYALREDGSPAFGDFGALSVFAGVAARHGADALAISPVHALFLADADRYSPYSPSTRLFLNGYFAPTRHIGFETAAAADALTDWGKAWPAKRQSLRRAFAEFQQNPDRQAAFEDFRRKGGADLERHAIFEALHAHFLAENDAKGWPDWAAAFHDVGSPAVNAFAQERADEVTFHVFVQWLADRGLADAQAAAVDTGMAIGLIADLAVGMDAGGSHAWSRRNDLLNGLSVGAPPDLFQPKGQDWGLAAFSPFALMANGYAPFIDTLRSAMRHAGGARIDHAMGLKRLWLTPKGAEAKDGAYLSYPFEDMLRLIKLESYRARAIVLAEDLGTVPEGFRESLDAAGVMGMRVLWFERDGHEFIPPDHWSASAVAMTSTHDLQTVAGWWRGADLDWRVQLADRPDPTQSEEDQATRENEREALWNACVDIGTAKGARPPADRPAEAVDAAIGFVGSANCRLALVQMEDLIGTEDQANLPGVTEGHPNWRRRLPASGDELFSRPDVAARVDILNRIRPK